MKIKFAHVADCHLGAWRLESLNQIGYDAFNKMIDLIIEESVDFLIISGDLYDVSNPKVDVIDLATQAFKKLSDAKIPVYGIMGSHDFSPSDKSMIRPLISADLFQNVSEPNWVEGSEYPLRLKFFKNKKTQIKLTGMRARKRALELEDYKLLDREHLEKEEGAKIFVLHTMVSELKPEEYKTMESGPKSMLPRNFLYYAGGHIHKTLPEQLRVGVYIIKKDFELQQKVVYPGCLYPKDFRELETLQYGGFCLVSGDTSEAKLDVKYIPLKLKEIIKLYIDANNKASSKVQEIIDLEILRGGFEDKIIVMRIEGKLSAGNSYDINTNEIAEKIRQQGAYEIVINKASLTSEKYESIKIEPNETKEDIETRLIYEHAQKAELKGMSHEKVEQTIHQLLTSISREQNEGEKVKDYDKEMLDLFYTILGINLEEEEEEEEEEED